jgi:thiol-disulfide isomerase/thioredoxin
MNGSNQMIKASSRTRIGVVVAAAALLTLSRVAGAQEGIAVGATAPGAAVLTLDGKAADLSQYIGKTPVVLEFWATWCPLCKKLEPSLQAAREKYAGKVTFVSVGVNSNQTAEKQKGFVDAHHMGGTFVFDRDGKAVAAYKVPHTSYLVVIDSEGKVVYTGVGAEQNVDEAVAKAIGMDKGGE